MAELLNQITAFFEVIVLTIGYPGIFLVMFAENIFTPIPTEPFLPLAGILSGKGEMNFFVAWAAATAGATTGSLVLYLVGKRGGEPVVRALIRRFGRYAGISESELDRARELFNRYGPWVVFIGRWIPVVRPGVSLIAGISSLRLPVFLLFTALSSSLANVIWITVGYVLGENWQQFLAELDRYQSVVIAGAVLLAVIVVFVVGRRWVKSRRSEVMV
ncbi:MAG: DedA family protein [Anaerolineae bacterium]|nr:DedA family protein [Anaerolineae bacterium]